MIKKIGLVLSVLVFIGTSIYLYTLQQQEMVPLDSNKEVSTIDLWVSTPAILSLVDKYEKLNEDIQVNTRYFSSNEFLLEELYSAVSIGNPPDMVELNSNYGIYDLIKQKSILNLSNHLPTSLLTNLNNGVASRFLYNDALWAFPLGYSLPVLYYNKSLIENYNIDIQSANTWDSLIHLSLKLRKKVYVDSFWAFHTDLQTPWYFLTLLNQQKTKRKDIIPEQLNKDMFEKWNSIVHESGAMPPLTHHLAITQFVNGNGGVLLSSTEKYKFLEKLIAGKFDLGIMPIPITSKSSKKYYIPKTSGLVLLSSVPKENKVNSIDFLTYLSKPEQVVQFFLQTNYIPAQKKVIQAESIRKFLKANPTFGRIVTQENNILHYPISPDDEEIWKTLFRIQEELEK